VQSSTVIGLRITNFSGNGIVIDPANANESVHLNNCRIYNNDNAGVRIFAGRNHSVFGATVVEQNSTDGISIAPGVINVQINNSAIQQNQLAGVALAGNGHDVAGCHIVNNGTVEPAGNHYGGVVFGSSSVTASGCRVEDCTLAGNTPYGAKLVFGADNRVNENEIYFNATQGIRVISVPQQAWPTLSFFVVDDVHDKIILKRL
jgi:hypothetical protein